MAIDFIPLEDDAARQFIDSVSIMLEFRRTLEKLQKYRGSMYYKAEGDYTYLVRNYPGNKQHRFGRQSEETDKILQDFTAEKERLGTRSKSLEKAFLQAQRLNRACRVGRVPDMVVSLLNCLEHANLGEHFTVVGTHSLYAYEACAGVRIAAGALATQDVDLLWDARKRISFIMEMEKLDVSMLELLRKVDRTFERHEEKNSTAINADGFEIDFLRRQPEGDDVHPFCFSKDEDDLWPIQALRANVLTTAPRFEHPIVSITGKMAMMRTIDPKTFITFKSWLASQAPNRDAIKKKRDARQSKIVQALLDEGLLLSGASNPAETAPAANEEATDAAERKRPEPR